VKTGNEIRGEFLDYFKSHEHAILPSSSLVPVDDPSVLFTTAGMQQFKPYYSGEQTPPSPRIATTQKCMRTSDIESVGNSSHLTFFEMLGNFSFDDYFKREAIEFAWELVTEKLGLDGERIWPTVFGGEGQVPRDEESAAIWEDLGVPRERIKFFGREDNFWGPTGDSGPCGPCSELHYRMRPPPDGEEEVGPNIGGERFLELWNLVFNQFHQANDGSLTPLPAVGVDTGAGLERWVVLLQDKDNVYDTDLFAEIMRSSMDALGVKTVDDEAGRRALRIVTEHARASVFLIGDGVMPGNEGRGYVLRRLLRRVVGQARQFGMTEPFIGQVAGTTIDVMGRFYPEVGQRRGHILNVVQEEEEQFGVTVTRGLRSLETVFEEHAAEKLIPGEVAFRFHDTHGVPFDLLRDVAEARGFEVDAAAFGEEMEMQRERSRASMAEDELGLPTGLGETEFTGYDNLVEESAKVVAIVSGGEVASLAQAGKEVGVVLDRTPFYAESGGQVGDRGVLRGGETVFRVEDTQSVPEGTRFHVGRLEEGTMEVGDTLEAVVEGRTRKSTARNHTATHLLHGSLRQVLGEHVHQAGSLVSPEHLRFDFTQGEALSREEIQEIEWQVNERVLAALPVSTTETEVGAAIEAGAMALFGEKYGDVVSLVSIGDVSRELCGGTHVGNTAEIGSLAILREENIGSGLRRIEAVTGEAAARQARDRLNTVQDLAAALDVGPDGVEARVRQVMDTATEQRREIARLHRQMAGGQVDSLLVGAEDVGGVKILVTTVEAGDAESLRKMSELMQARLEGAWAFLIGAVVTGKPLFFATASDTAVAKGIHCGDAVKAAASVTGGGGGGRANQANGGGKDPERLSEGLGAARIAFVESL
jgi:alanyl-tRNA synthetase